LKDVRRQMAGSAEALLTSATALTCTLVSKLGDCKVA